MLKRKSSIALITAIIVMLLLIPIWYTMLIPYLIGSQLEHIDATTTLVGRIKGFALYNYYQVYELSIRIEAHAYTEKVRGDIVVMKAESNMVRTDTNEVLPDFSGTSTYVFNKITRKYVPDAPEADINRTGYGATMYPSHLKAGENISNVWVDSLNTTGTLVFNRTVVENGVTLHEYFLNETVKTKFGTRNATLIATKTILIEPLMGVPAYTKNETFFFGINYPGQPDKPPFRFIYLTYRDTDEAIAWGLENAKMAYNGAQIMEIYVPTIFGVIAIILTIGLVFNIRRLKRKKPPTPKTESPA